MDRQINYTLINPKYIGFVGFVYYARERIPNHASVNMQWYWTHSVIGNKLNGHPQRDFFAHEVIIHWIFYFYIYFYGQHKADYSATVKLLSALA